KALELVPHIEKELENYEDKINKEKQLLFNYNLAYTFFGAGDYRKALKYINDVLNDNEKQLRQDIYSFSRIFNLIIHFELNNHDFIEYDIKSAARFLNKFEKDYEVENLFVAEMKNLAKTNTPAERRKIFERFDAQLTELLKNDQENVILEYFDLRSWIKSKLNGTSFSDEIKQQQSRTK
ncbi:MAG: hypothetical protein JNJ99_05715, partial [Crocinitomicaceae bacterium]|nr:hypothetical protein [Crocinitomicaceae bacterium]